MHVSLGPHPFEEHPVKYLKLAAPGIAAAYAAGYITGTDMYKKKAAEANSENMLAVYRYGAAGIAAIAIAMVLHRAG